MQGAGKIMRMTIPKSQGKQPYYDARKSSWGDMFPHEPKNKPQQRFQSTDAQTMKTSNRNAGNDKRNKANHKAPSEGEYKYCHVQRTGELTLPRNIDALSCVRRRQERPVFHDCRQARYGQYQGPGS